MTTTDNPLKTGSAQPEGSMIQYDSPHGPVHAYLSRPKGSTAAAPGVLVIHENKGLVPYLKDVADGLASNGYVALAPDLLSPDGGTTKFADPITEVPPVLSGIPAERHLQLLQAAVSHLASLPGVDGQKLGVIGFCFGGGLTWRLSTKEPRLTAAVPFYGPTPPLEDVANIKARVFAIYAGLDERINASIEGLRGALEKAGVTHEIKVVPDVQHAFHNHTGGPERYNADAARESWQDALAWFQRHLRS